jgi:hypothetical protein
MMIYIVVFLLILYVYLSATQKEGFSVVSKEDPLQSKIYRDEKIYDNFYTYIYDDVVLTIPYLIELIQIVRPYLHNSSHTLCIGSKTGHLVQLLKESTRITGLESSTSMVKMSQYKYPDNEFIRGDYTDTSLFASHKFSHAILPLLTIHTLPNFKEICYNVKEWTVHSGYFFVCFTDINKFPIYKMVNQDPSDYFKSKYDYSVELNNLKLTETIKDAAFKERTNIQQLYEYNEMSVIHNARAAGFSHITTLRFKSIPFSVCVFQNK